MKRQLLSLASVLGLVLALGSNAHASKREFRINPESANGGYAIAWGFQGEKTDFERLDKLSDDALAKVFVKHGKRSKNFLVQLETNTVLEIFDGKGRTNTATRIDGRVGESVFSDQFGLSVVPAFATNLPHGQKLLFVLQQTGRVTTVREMLTIEESQRAPTRIVSASLAFNRLFDQALTKFLSPAALAQYRKTNGFVLSLKPSFEKPFEEIQFEVTASNSRDESVMTFNGKMRVTFNAGEPTLELIP